MIAVFAVVSGGTDAPIVVAGSVAVAHDNSATVHTCPGTFRFACFAREERTGADAVEGAVEFFADPISVALHHHIIRKQPGTADVTFLPMIATHHNDPSRKPIVAFAFSIHHITVNAFQCAIFQLARPC